MKSYGFLFWAYNVIWIGLAAWLGLMLARINRTRRRVEHLERRLEGSRTD